MTEHPLTFQDIAKISKQRLITTELCDDMRAAADWQLAQCLDYIRTTQGDNAMVSFMEAMRPTKTSEKVQRWIDGASEEELLKLINQLEDN